MIGTRCNKLTVIGRAEPIIRKRDRVKALMCKCDCGKVFAVDEYKISHKLIISCGCERKKSLHKTLIERNSKSNAYRIDGDIVYVSDCKNKTFMISKCDLEKIQNFYYGVSNGYAGRYIERGKKLLLHRELLNCPTDMVVDHINGNTLDNRRENLRICTKQQNELNKSWVKGVYKTKYNTYEAYIMFNQRTIHLGTYKTYKEAFSARRKAELQYFGEYARKEIKCVNY